MYSQKTRLISCISLVALTLGITACGGETQTPTSTNTGAGTTSSASPAAATSNAASTVLVDGSSTVFPISEAMAEEFQKANSGIRVTVGVSGTGGGFKKFCAGETDISNASRPIKQEEIELCKKNNIEYIELPISYDGLSVVVNPKNEFAKCMKVEELKTMWEPAAQGKVTNWNQVNPAFPDQKLGLYGAGTDSGTYDYFVETVVGKKESRGDYTASEDDNVIVQGVAADVGGLGFFGYAYYKENQDKLKIVEIDGGQGCVAPSETTIADGTYKPLSRPEFVYVKKTAAERPEVKAFVNFMFAPENQKLISEVGYIPLPKEIVSLTQKRFENRTLGTIFGGKPTQISLKELMQKEEKAPQ